MKTRFLTLLSALTIFATQFVTQAQTGEQPIITIHTNIYQQAGPENDFVIYMGMTSDDYIDIDGGFGAVEVPVSVAAFDSESQSVKATQVATRVSADGVVKIYGDASKIDYLDVTGTYITRIDMSSLTNLEILTMDHNELEALDLTPFTKLQSIEISDNPFNVSPLVVGSNKPDLVILTLDIIGAMSSDFNLSDYPNLVTFSAWANKGLHSIDPTACPLLRRISIDGTDVSSIDVSKNPALEVLNISDTRISSIDLSNCPKLGEFYAQHMSGVANTDYKLSSIDLSNNPLIYYLYLSGNDLTELDVTPLTNLMMLGVDHNLLTSIDLSHNSYLYEVNVSYNNMDFATLPINPGTWGNYICEQNPLKVDLSFPVGARLDLKDRVLRQGYTTTAEVYLQDTYNPNSLTALDPSYYSFNEGVLTFNKVTSDSVYVQFYNDAFDECRLQTTKFIIKSADSFGKPSQMLTMSGDFSQNEPLNLYVAVEGASEATPQTIYVDCGDSAPVAIEITDAVLPAEPNVTLPAKGYGNKRLLVDDGVYISGVGCHTMLYSFDASAMSSLQDLDLSGAGLYSIDLTKNSRLRRLNLSDNMLGMINLAGTNGGNSKTNLNYINLAGNRLEDFEVPDNRTLVELDLSRNQLAELGLRDSDNLTVLNVADNLLTELDLTYCTGLVSLQAQGNHLESLTIAQEATPAYIDISGNNFTFASLPTADNLSSAEYIYAPQSPISIPTIGPGVNLSAQNVDINGNLTAFVWRKSNGDMATEGVDYTLSDGITRFVNTQMGEVVCEMTNAGMPQLTLKTTAIEAAGMPTNLLAEFSTPVGGETAELSLAAVSGSPALYIDWSGTDDLSQYQLKDTYTLFEATTVQGARVKVYTYKPEEKISVFSVSGVTMTNADFSKMTDLSTLTLSGGGLTDLVLPESAGLKELVLEGNELDHIDLSAYPQLYMLSLAKNNFKSFDISGMKNLQLFSMSGNQLTSLTMDNSKLWFLDLSNNLFDEIDLSGASKVEQLSLGFNQLTTIDISALNKLQVLHLDGNRFNYATLPLPKKSYYQYVYQNQADITPEVIDNCIVDLSFNKAAADNTATEYRWYIGKPVIDDNGLLDGEELYIDDEYTLSEGVTTFIGKFTDLVCVMTNPAFPDMYMYTTPIAVQSNSLASDLAVADVDIRVVGSDVLITAPADINVALFDIKGICHGRDTLVNGQARFSGLASGVYLLVTEAGTFKVIVK